MLRELGEFVDRLQHELEVRGIRNPEEAIQIEIKCRSIVEWAVLDQAVDQAFRDMYADWRHLLEPVQYDRVRIPHMMTYKRTAIRITYDH